MCHIVILYLYLIFIVGFAHQTDGEVLILRQRKLDDPIYIKNLKPHPLKSSPNHLTENKSYSRPKRARSNKQAILHYGRHIYHLDKFDNFPRLRSVLPKRDRNHKIYDYINIKDLVPTRAHKNDNKGYVKDLIILSEPPIHLKCNKHGKCNEDYRKFSKITKKADLEWKHKRMPIGHSKRFTIVDNRKKKKQKLPERSSIEDENNRKRPPPIFDKKKYSVEQAGTEESESQSQEEEESETGETEEDIGSKEPQRNMSEDSESEVESRTEESASQEEKTETSEAANSASEDSSESWDVQRDVYETNSEEQEEQEDQEEDVEKPKRTLKNKNKYSEEEVFSEELSEEEELVSIEKEKKKRKKGKKKKRKKLFKDDLTEESSEESNRKQFGSEDVILQGNRMYHGSDVYHPKRSSSKRRRLQQFLPKRYHWDASDIHNLGYFWYNGPKGRYAAPQGL